MLLIGKSLAILAFSRSGGQSLIFSQGSGDLSSRASVAVPGFRAAAWQQRGSNPGRRAARVPSPGLREDARLTREPVSTLPGEDPSASAA